MHAATCFTLISLVGLGWALATGDLTYRYVASWASSSMPLLYRIGAVWAGPAGALLLWALVLGGGASVAAATMPRGGVLRAWTTALLAPMLLAVLAMACLGTNPFTRLAFPPDDGRGVPLEWLRPIALVQEPMGYLGMALAIVPAVMTVMGAMGNASWRAGARRWSLATWALLGAAMLLDWRRRYGDTAWAMDWQWAPVHDGTAFAWIGATILLLAALRRWPVTATATTAFVAFTLALAGLTIRRAHGWDGVHAFAATPTGRAAAWLALAASLAVSVELLRASSALPTLLRRAIRTAQGAALLGAVALVATGWARSAEIEVREGESTRVTDRFGAPWSLSLEGVSKVGREDVVSTVVAVRGAVAGRARGYVTADVRTLFSRTTGQAVAEEFFAGVSTGLLQDLRVDVRDAGTAEAVLNVQFVPLAAWLWFAGIVAVVAAFVAALAPRAPTDGEDA